MHTCICWKLCFLHLHLPKFFYAIIGLSCNCFSLGMPEMQVSHICIQCWKRQLLCNVKTLFWGEVGGGSAIYNWLLFQNLLQATILIFLFLFFFLVLTWLNFFCGLRVLGGVSLLPNRLSFNVFFFLLWIMLQVQGWWHLTKRKQKFTTKGYYQMNY